MRPVVAGSSAVVFLLLAACGSDGNDSARQPPPPEQPLPAGTLQFDVGEVRVAESGASVEVAITRTGGSHDAVFVTLSTGNGTATAGQDFKAVNATVGFANGDAATKTVSIPIFDDGVEEAEETFTVTLSNPTNRAELGTRTAMSVTIEANDVPLASPPPPPSVATLSVALGIKQLQFSWPAVSGATHYKLLENPEGVSPFFTQAGSNIVAPTTSATLDIAVHRHNWVNARYKLAACNAGGCTESNEVNSMGAALQAVGYFKASNTDAHDRFGGSMALSADGNTMAVGARGEASAATGINGDQTDNSAPGIGAVYVFTHTGNAWSQQAYVKPSNGGSSFGHALALSADGDTMAVGASDGSGSWGADGVYVFTRAGSTWSQQAHVTAANGDGSGDEFGSAVALSADGDTLAVGANREDGAATGINGDETDNTASDAGAAYVFTRAGSIWSQQAYVKASNAGADDLFGSVLSLSADGDTLAVGAFFEASAARGINGDETDNSAPASGAAYVFTRAGSTWTQQAYVKASNAQGSDLFGASLSLSADGDTLAVGAYGEDSNARGINRSQVSNSALDAGAAYVFTRAGSTWSQQAYVKASNTETSDGFGSALMLSADGDTLVVGAPGEASAATGINGDQTDNSTYSGAVYMFTRASSTWSQQTYVKPTNPDFYDAFGRVLALSADGQTLAVGAIEEDSNATGINGDPLNNFADAAGAVHLY